MRDIRILCKNILVKKYREDKKKLYIIFLLFDLLLKYFLELQYFIASETNTGLSYKVSVKFEDKEWIKRAITNTWRQVN